MIFAATRRLEFVQELPIALQQAWDFFSRPENLARITPPNLCFEIVSPLPERMYAGLIVNYRVRPFGSLAVPWTTEITHLEEPRLFVDEQRSGPYRFWHHLHRFEPVDGGVRMTDIVHYRLPLGGVGELFAGASVRHRLEAIFAYRRRALEEMFGELEVADGSGGAGHDDRAELVEQAVL